RRDSDCTIGTDSVPLMIYNHELIRFDIKQARYRLFNHSGENLLNNLTSMSDTTKADDRETPSEATSGYSSMASFRDATDKSTSMDAESSTKDTSSDRKSAKKKAKDLIAKLQKFREFNFKDTSDVEVCSFFVGEYFNLHPETPEEEIISEEQLVATIHDFSCTCREKLDNEIISDLVLKGRIANLWNRFLRDESSIIGIVNLIETLILEFEISINEKKMEALERKKSDKSPTEEMQTAEGGDKPIEDASVTAIKGSPSTTSPEDGKPMEKDASVTSIKSSTATSTEGDKPMEEDASVTSIKDSTATTSPEGEKQMEEDASVTSIKDSTATASPEGEKPMEEDASVTSIKDSTATTSAEGDKPMEEDASVTSIKGSTATTFP
ncbi:hypothetical protein CEXT_546651, partial [Caerostris extrusa]